MKDRLKEEKADTLKDFVGKLKADLIYDLPENEINLVISIITKRLMKEIGE